LYFATLPQQIWTILMFSVSIFAFRQGGRPERIVAVVNVLAWAATPMMYRADWWSAQWGMLGVDVLFFLGLAWLAVTTNRTWLLFAAAFQLLGVITHFAMVVDPGVRAGAYLRGLVIWSYMVLGSLGVGAWQCWRMRQVQAMAGAPMRR
jgi:hypothetical protein